MFSAIAQLIQAEAPQGFSAKAHAATTDGASEGGSFAELLTLLQAATADAPTGPTVAAGAVSEDDMATDTAAEGADAAVVEGADAEAPADGAGAASPSPVTTNPPAATSPESGTVSATGAPPVTTEANAGAPSAEVPVVVAANGEDSAVEALPRAVAANASDAETTPSATGVESPVVDNADVDAPETALPTKPVVATSLDDGDTPDLSAPPAIGEPKLKVVGQTVKAKVAEKAPTVSPTPVVEAPDADASVPVRAAKAAPDPALPEAEVSLPETTQAKAAAVARALRVDGDAAVQAEPEVTEVTEEAAPQESAKPRPSIFASFTRRTRDAADPAPVHEPELLRLADTQRGRPVAMRAMLLMQTSAQDGGDVPEVETAGKPEGLGGVERSGPHLRSESLSASAPAEIPESVELPPQRSTLPEVGKSMLRGVRYLVNNGERTITVRLVPESLGELRLDVVTKGDEISLRMASASPAVRDALEGHMAGLREQLHRDGIEVKQINISADMNGGDGRGQQASREAASESARAFARLSRNLSNRGFSTMDPAPAAYAPRDALQRGGLNVFA